MKQNKILSIFCVTESEESGHAYDEVSIYNNITQNPDIISGLQIAAGVLICTVVLNANFTAVHT